MKGIRFMALRTSLLVGACLWVGLLPAQVPDTTTSIDELKKIEKKGKDAGEAAYQLGLRYLHGIGVKENPEEAVDWFFEACKEDHAEGLHMMGYCYATGYGVKQDDRQALKYYKDGAIRGSLGATYKAAVFYEKGIASSADPREALKYYQWAAEKNLPAAQYKVGMNLYHEKQDYPAGVKEFIKAAEAGYSPAQAELGRAYYRGVGVTRRGDYVSACKWFLLAGDEESLAEAKRLFGSMPSTDAAEAKRLAETFVPTRR